MKVSVRVSSHLSTIILKFSLLVLFIGGFIGTGIYFYTAHRENERKELAWRIEQVRLLQEQADKAERERVEAQNQYKLEQQRLRLEADRIRQQDEEKQRLANEERQRLRLAELERVRMETELRNKLKAEEDRKNYLNNVSSSAFDILASLREVFPSDSKTDRNTYDKISPVLIEHIKFVSSLQADRELFALESVVDLVNFVQINQNVIIEAKKKNDSWGAYVASLNSPEKKKQEEESKRRGKEAAATATADLQRKLEEKKQARERQLKIWLSAGGNKPLILGEGK